jgi:folate-binding protein YgfZ
MRYLALDERALIRIVGDGARRFLQDLISNDIDKLEPDAAIHAALLTPQGKYLHDFFAFEHAAAIYLDCEAGRREDLVRRLKRYRLRLKIDIEEDDTLTIFALHGEGVRKMAGPFADGLVYTDPRLAALGARAALPDGGAAALEAAGFEPMARDDYERRRIEHGVPDGSRDLVIEKALLLESGFEELAGVDFDKGCYVGQEVTARMKHRGLVRKRLLPVAIDGPGPAPGTAILRDGAAVGEMRTSIGDCGLALLRLEDADKATSGEVELLAGDARIRPLWPDWLQLAERRPRLGEAPA